MRQGNPWLGAGLVTLGALVAACAVLGPLALDVIAYRTSPTSLNQIVGADAVGLLVVAPISILLGLRAFAGRPGASLLALAPAGFCMYTYTQLIVGNEYLERPGNVERFFPLLLAVFVLAAAVATAAWTAAAAEPLPVASARGDRIAGLVLLAIAAFVLLVLHLPSWLDALSPVPTNAGYLSSPTAFWLVKFMDLGILVPAATVVGVGMVHRRPWARRPMHALVGGYTLLGISVAAMAVTMQVEGDPDASPALVAGSTVAACALLILAVSLYRPGPSLGRSAPVSQGRVPQSSPKSS